MAGENDKTRYSNDGEDEDILDFDFDEDLFGEEGGEREKEEEVIDLVDVVEEGRAPESVEEDIEGLEGLLSDEEEVEVKQGAPSGEEEEAEVKEGIGKSVEGEAGEDTVLLEEMEAAPVEEEPALDLDEEIKLFEEVLSQEDTGELKEQLLEEAVSKEEVPEEVFLQAPAEERAEEEGAIREAPPISEERIEAVLTKVVTDVLERVARQVIPEVAGKIIREEIDVLKKSIMPED